MRMKGWPVLAVAAATLLVGGVRLVQNESDQTGLVTLAAGLILLGAWLAIEIRDSRDENDDEN